MPKQKTQQTQKETLKNTPHKPLILQKEKENMREFALKHPGSQNKMQKAPYLQLQEVGIGNLLQKESDGNLPAGKCSGGLISFPQVTLGKVRDNL